jgi:hypothetical protein
MALLVHLLYLYRPPSTQCLPPFPPPHTHPTHTTGGLCQGNALKESLRRYERLWLPLIAQQQAVAGGPHGYSHLVPPLDVALLWHLHRLQPEAYAAGGEEPGVARAMPMLLTSCAL